MDETQDTTEAPPEAQTFSQWLYAKRKGQRVGIVNRLTGESAMIECSNVPEAKAVYETASKMIACGASNLAELARDLMEWHGDGKRKEVRDQRPGLCPHCDAAVDVATGYAVCHACGSSFTVDEHGHKRAVSDD